MDKVNINIQVGDFKHRMTVDVADEPICREAARLVNERLIAYQTKYRAAKLDPEYILTFAALDIAIRLVRLQRTTDVGPVESVIGELISELEHFNQNR